MDYLNTLSAVGIVIVALFVILFSIARYGRWVRTRLHVAPTAKLLDEVLQSRDYPRESQRAAIQKIRISFNFLKEMVRKAESDYFRGRVAEEIYETATTSVKMVETLCSEHMLDRNITGAYINSCIKLISHPEYNDVRLKLAKKYNR